MTDSKKIVIIDDSAFMRRVISDIIEKEKSLEVIATASNGLEGIEIIERYEPDAVILDINMPRMNGLKMLEEFKNTRNIPIIVLSSLAMDGAEETIRALELGAFDFITKPVNLFETKRSDFSEVFIEKLKIAMSAKIVKSMPQETKTHQIRKKVTGPSKKIIALGCSTGGPKALHSIIPLLPKDLAASMIIVQHMPRGFTNSLANRLNELSEVRVKEAEHGEVIEEGTVYIAKGGCHMTLTKEGKNHLIKLTDDLPRDGHRPSVNVMMDSLCDSGFDEVIGVILTGMGADGTEGLKHLKEHKKTYVLAQDEDSCIVFGMPKSIIEKNIADEVVSLQDFPEAITNKVGVH